MHSGVWTEAIQVELDGLEAAETFAEISEVPTVSNIVVKVALEVEGRRAWHVRLVFSIMTVSCRFGLSA